MKHVRLIWQNIFLLCCAGAIGLYLCDNRKMASTREIVYSEIGHLPPLVVLEKLLVNGKPDEALRIAEGLIDQSVFTLNSINDQIVHTEDREAVLECLLFIKQRRISRTRTGASRDRQVLASNIVNELVQKLDFSLRKGR